MMFAIVTDSDFAAACSLLRSLQHQVEWLWPATLVVAIAAGLAIGLWLGRRPPPQFSSSSRKK